MSFESFEVKKNIVSLVKVFFLLMIVCLQTLKDPTFIGPYDSIAVYADHSAINFFKKNDFTDDVVLNSRFT